jgi:hypothetical protein
MPRPLSAALVLGGALFAAHAEAHIDVDFPPHSFSEQKASPCGGGTEIPGAVTTLTAGQKLVVKFHETINHPGWFRISFDADGMDDFYVMKCKDDQPTNEPTILLDKIPDEPDKTYEVEVTLPNVTCTSCTLQVIQVMTDKNPGDCGANIADWDWEPDPVTGSNEIYFRCSKLVLEEGGGPTSSTTGAAGSGGAAGGPTSGGGGGAGPTSGNGAAGVTSGGEPVAFADDDEGGCSFAAPPGSSRFSVALIAALVLARLRRRARVSARRCS